MHRICEEWNRCAVWVWICYSSRLAICCCFSNLPRLRSNQIMKERDAITRDTLWSSSSSGKQNSFNLDTSRTNLYWWRKQMDGANWENKHGDVEDWSVLSRRSFVFLMMMMPFLRFQFEGDVQCHVNSDVFRVDLILKRRGLTRQRENAFFLLIMLFDNVHSFRDMQTNTPSNIFGCMLCIAHCLNTRLPSRSERERRVSERTSLIVSIYFKFSSRSVEW